MVHKKYTLTLTASVLIAIFITAVASATSVKVSLIVEPEEPELTMQISSAEAERAVSSLKSMNASKALSATATAPTTTVTATDPVSIDLDPTAGPAFSSSDVNITVMTTNSSGYYLTMEAKDTSLKNVSASIPSLANSSSHPNGYTCTTSTAATCNFPTNTWGYKINSATSLLAASNYKAIPTSLKLEDTTTATSGNTTRLNFGAKVDASQPAGTYSGTVKFTATANVKPILYLYNYGNENNSVTGGWIGRTDYGIEGNTDRNSQEAGFATSNAIDFRGYSTIKITYNTNVTAVAGGAQFAFTNQPMYIQNIPGKDGSPYGEVLFRLPLSSTTTTIERKISDNLNGAAYTGIAKAYVGARCNSYYSPVRTATKNGNNLYVFARQGSYGSEGAYIYAIWLE